VNAAALKDFALLSEFSDEDREALFELLEPKTLNNGRSIFREGSEADRLVFVVSGDVIVTNNRCPDTASVGPGAALGCLSLFVMGRREATAKAEGRCEILQLPRTSYRRLVEDAPGTACRLTEAIVKQLTTCTREALDAVVAGTWKYPAKAPG
jgi:CRP-like cAMP-binding protein